MGVVFIFPSSSGHLENAQVVLWQLLRLGLKSEIVMMWSNSFYTHLGKLSKPLI